jgi:hypothetical protein
MAEEDFVRWQIASKVDCSNSIVIMFLQKMKDMGLVYWLTGIDQVTLQVNIMPGLQNLMHIFDQSQANVATAAAPMVG